ncbi:unnamed protein product [Periconia digitata]|uniref:Uncharacterized protein n=1 Tax=Periconia digitata TaxID=1303443 RepID=A0A9W4UDQ0_9PLEO|nr:unnamed protein product [Periconia digitata]
MVSKEAITRQPSRVSCGLCARREAAHLHSTLTQPAACIRINDLLHTHSIPRPPRIPCRQPWSPSRPGRPPLGRCPRAGCATLSICGNARRRRSDASFLYFFCSIIARASLTSHGYDSCSGPPACCLAG